MITNPSGIQRPIISRIFISPDVNRLRAGWRLIIQTIIMLLFIGCIGIPAGLIVTIPNNSTSDQNLLLLNEVISLIAITLSVFFARRFIDKRSISSLGLKISTRAIRDLIVGFLIAFISLAFLYVMEVVFGWVKFNSFAWEVQPPGTVLSRILLSLVVFILVGWNEELLACGYHLQVIESGTNTSVGLIVSAIMFGMLHIFNPNANWVSTMGVTLAGIFLGFGYVRTRLLWLPIGLHIGWNFSEGVIFGFPVSGLTGFQITNNTFSGPLLWTGGSFGPEAGLIVLPALILGTGLIYFYTLPKFQK